MHAETKAQVLAGERLAHDLATLATTDSAPEIVAIARRYLGRQDVQRAAWQALATIWPGFYSNAPALTRHLVKIEAQRRLATSPLALVPVDLDEMEDGYTYLAATYGTTGIVATVVQGACTARAENFAAIFRIDVIQ